MEEFKKIQTQLRELREQHNKGSTTQLEYILNCIEVMEKIDIDHVPLLTMAHMMDVLCDSTDEI